MTEQSTSRRLVERPQVADYLSVSQRWVLRAVAERRLPYVKVGRLVRFDLDAIDEWIDQQTHPAA